jgi:hypothetical protein
MALHSLGVYTIFYYFHKKWAFCPLGLRSKCGMSSLGNTIKSVRLTFLENLSKMTTK